VTVLFRPLRVLNRVSDPTELRATAQLLETVAGWVDAADEPPLAPAEDGTLPLPFPGAEYDET
jgi:hypothetical protein